jgi:hypothetical protein
MGHNYNEKAFRYFLAVEKMRAVRARRSFLLLLVSLKGDPRSTHVIPPAVAAGIFSGLWSGVREADFVGWFRDGRVAGAVLTQGAQTVSGEVVAEIAQRINEILCQRVPPDVARRLQVRVLQLRTPQES